MCYSTSIHSTTRKTTIVYQYHKLSEIPAAIRRTNHKPHVESFHQSVCHQSLLCMLFNPMWFMFKLHNMHVYDKYYTIRNLIMDKTLEVIFRKNVNDDLIWVTWTFPAVLLNWTYTLYRSAKQSEQRQFNSHIATLQVTVNALLAWNGSIRKLRKVAERRKRNAVGLRSMESSGTSKIHMQYNFYVFAATFKATSKTVVFLLRY